MKYRQLTQTQRYQISALRVAGKSQRQIAAILGCHNSTVSRELRRNSVHGYEPEMAQHQTNSRRKVSVHSATFCHPAEIRSTVTSHFPIRGYPHEKAPYSRTVADP
ncbi:MAG: helix-turn-helix domain-containing protein, partial [Alteromonadaceae bacterium]|nr:helix-turn-helix domain-containing protein [Alteromonadaceae bacterium]